jgi:hypothetical protein
VRPRKWRGRRPRTPSFVNCYVACLLRLSSGVPAICSRHRPRFLRLGRGSVPARPHVASRSYSESVPLPREGSSCSSIRAELHPLPESAVQPLDSVIVIAPPLTSLAVSITMATRRVTNSNRVDSCFGSKPKFVKSNGVLDESLSEILRVNN